MGVCFFVSRYHRLEHVWQLVYGERFRGRRIYGFKKFDIAHSTSKPVFRQVIRQMPVYNTPKNVAQEDNNLHLAQTLLTAADSRTGMKVYHSTFGKGVIVEINADRVKVDFEKSGQKVLLYQFAKIRQIIEE